jgi:hypothetical protein
MLYCLEICCSYSSLYKVFIGALSVLSLCTGKAVLFPITRPFKENLLYSYETVPLKSYSLVFNMYINDYEHACDRREGSGPASLPKRVEEV